MPHLYTLLLDEVDTPAARARCEALLAPSERARRDRYAFERNRREYLYAHALVRLALSRQVPEVAPAAWWFSEGSHGRPEVAGPPGVPHPRFNLSHTEGLVACIVAQDVEVGVDVEAIDRRSSTAAIAERYFAPPEVAALRALDTERQRDRFFAYWTLKESYIKARGLGLALPLDRFWFTLAPGAPIRIDFAADLDDDPARWRFTQRSPSPRHLLAAAVAATGGRPPPAPLDGGSLL